MASDVSDDAFNVGSGTEVSVREIVEQLLELTGADVEPEYDARRSACSMTRRVGSSDAREGAARLGGASSTSTRACARSSSRVRAR